MFVIFCKSSVLAVAYRGQLVRIFTTGTMIEGLFGTIQLLPLLLIDGYNDECLAMDWL